MSITTVEIIPDLTMDAQRIVFRLAMGDSIQVAIINELYYGMMGKEEIYNQTKSCIKKFLDMPHYKEDLEVGLNILRVKHLGLPAIEGHQDTWAMYKSQYESPGIEMKNELKEMLEMKISSTSPNITIAHSAVDPAFAMNHTVQTLPGATEYVKHPVDGSRNSVWRTIINLNDRHKWTREQIADWLETLDIDIEFKTKEKTDEHQD